MASPPRDQLESLRANRTPLPTPIASSQQKPGEKDPTLLDRKAATKRECVGWHGPTGLMFCLISPSPYRMKL